MHDLKKFISRRPLLSLGIVFLLSRIINLTLLPIFTDEGLYIDWGWKAFNVPGMFFYSLVDAKQPLMTWFFGLGQLLPPDPLFGSRLMSVFAGLLSLIALWKISLQLFNSKVAVISGLIYITSPYFLFFDRQALMESALVCISLWGFYFTLRMETQSKFLNSLWVGIVMGLGFLTKTTGLLFIFAFLGIRAVSLLKKQDRPRHLTHTLFSVMVILIVCAPILLHPLFWATISTTNRWTLSLSEVFKFPVALWFENIVGNFLLTLIHLTPPVLLAGLVGIYLIIRTKTKQYVNFLLWLGIPLLAGIITQKGMSFVIFRYFLPLLPLLIVPAAYVFSLKPKILLPFLAVPAIFSLILIFDPPAFFRIQSSLTPYSYSEGYVTGLDTGYQVNAVVDWLKNNTPKSRTIVGIPIYSFDLESGIKIYLKKHPTLSVSFFDYRMFSPPEMLDSVDCFNFTRPFYYVFKPQDATPEEEAFLAKYFQKHITITNSQNPDYANIYTPIYPCSGKAFTVDIQKGIDY